MCYLVHLLLCFMPAVQSTNFPSTIENAEPSFLFQIPSRTTAVYVFWGNFIFLPKDIKGLDNSNDSSFFFVFSSLPFFLLKKPTYSKMTQEQHIVLNRTGQKMPLCGFGCWKVDPADAEETIYSAIKAGVR